MKKTLADPPASPLDARLEAQKIAFGPLMFQAARLLRTSGILAAVERTGRKGLTADEIATETGMSHYGVRVLAEAGLSLDLLRGENGRYVLGRVGSVILKDEMTRVNMDFTHDVCYQGLFHLDEAIRRGEPAGLTVFGEWPTIYEALAHLPPHVQDSWFAFDHHYSDGGFPDALPHIFEDAPVTVLDVGGNTGKFSVACAKFSETARVTILDLPGQLAKAHERIENAGLSARIASCPMNLLDHGEPFPRGFDVVWMSQFLCCFGLDDATELLRRGAAALNEDGSLWVLDTYWDRQANPVGTYVVHALSLYFTALANGTSRMYRSDDLLSCVEAAGLTVVEDIDGIGYSHSLWKCKRR